MDTMESPLLRFLEWFDTIPDIHKRKITGYIIMTLGAYPDSNAYEFENIVSFYEEIVNRFIESVMTLDRKLEKLPTPFYRWQIIGKFISLRAQIDFLLSHAAYYHYLEGGFIVYGPRMQFFDKPKEHSNHIQELQKTSLQEKEEQLVEIRNSWEQYKNKFATDEYIDTWLKDKIIS